MNEDAKVLTVGQIWRSNQNGQVYDPDGISPTICVGHHAGVEPKIIEFGEQHAEHISCAYGLSRTRDKHGDVIKRTLNPYVNCIHTNCGGGFENMWVLVVEVYG